MHLIDKDPVPKGYKSTSTVSSVPKKDSLGTAIKNKLRSAAGAPGRGVMKLVHRVTHDPKMRQADKDFNFLKDYNARAKSGVENSDKDRAIFKMYKDRK